MKIKFQNYVFSKTGKFFNIGKGILDFENGHDEIELNRIPNYFTQLPISPKEYRKQHGTQARIIDTRYKNDSLFVKITDDWGDKYVISFHEISDEFLDQILTSIHEEFEYE